MLILQDWNSADELAGPLDHHQEKTGQSRGFSTNTRIRRLLKEYFGLKFCDTYATDVMPYAKPGRRRHLVNQNFMRVCAREFTAVEISIVQPSLAICFGAKTFDAVGHAFQTPVTSTRSGCASFTITHQENEKITQIIHLRHPQAFATAEERASEWREAADVYALRSGIRQRNSGSICLLQKEGTCRAQCQDVA